MDDPSVDEKTVQKVAEMANAHQFVIEMKEKYKTECGEKGIQLSGILYANSFELYASYD